MDDFAIRNESTDKYSLRGRVFHKIRDDILNGKYKEHEELKEVAIGNELGVSRTPVREALRQLELEGLVQIIPNRGAFVTGIQPGDVVCYPGHVAIYYGDGVVVHAPSRGKKVSFGNLYMAQILAVRRLV